MTSDSTYRKTYPISWGQLHRDSKALAWRLLDHDYFKGIIAITRGGLVPAAIVARELDLHLIDTICISSYDWKDKKGEADILKRFPGDGEGWLLIDDLVDTGRTAKVVKEMIPKAAENKVFYVTGRPFHCNGLGRNTLRLNYSYPTLEQIDTGIRSLAQTIREYCEVKVE